MFDKNFETLQKYLNATDSEMQAIEETTKAQAVLVPYSYVELIPILEKLARVGTTVNVLLKVMPLLKVKSLQYILFHCR